MTDERLKEIAYDPLSEAWQIVLMTQYLTQNDEKKWVDYAEAHDAYCKKYAEKKNSYGYYLAMAVMAIVDEIAKENK